MYLQSITVQDLNSPILLDCLTTLVLHRVSQVPLTFGGLTDGFTPNHEYFMVLWQEAQGLHVSSQN